MCCILSGTLNYQKEIYGMNSIVEKATGMGNYLKTIILGRHLLDDIKFSLTNGFMKTGNTELTLEKSLIKVETWHFPRLVKKLDKTAQSMGKYYLLNKQEI